MANHTLRRRFASLGTVLGLGVALPFAAGATPAHAQAQLTITKTHEGDFPRGGQGVYRITVANTGDEPTSVEGTRMTDNYPEGLTFADLEFINRPEGTGCFGGSTPNTTICTSGQLPPGTSYTIEVTVDVAADAPCTVTNTASVLDLAVPGGDFVNDRTNIPGPDCPTADGDGGDTSVLPVDLSGLVPIYNNINTNTNFNSPGASNTNTQTFGATAP
ncbi:hypothetical protein [Streptomyces sp. NPDC090445]|uniref:DUF7933 domain-containing protein n=1 Tax=Streptomyces sp. NPDC090445 TaxID=3365963 RepID=UPI0038041CC8